MKSFKNHLPVILMILFELVVGILLLVNPEGFTSWVITCFGIILFIVALVYLIRFIRNAREEAEKTNYMTLVLCILALIAAIFCTFFSGKVMGLFKVAAVIYGVFLIISGVFKLKTFLDLKQDKLYPSAFLIVSAILSMVLGIIIILHPALIMDAIWIFTGIALLIEAVSDIIAFAISLKKQKESVEN